MRLVPHRPQGASGRMRFMQPPRGFRAGVYTGMAERITAEHEAQGEQDMAGGPQVEVGGISSCLHALETR